jgi:hypothetical protein
MAMTASTPQTTVPTQPSWVQRHPYQATAGAEGIAALMGMIPGLMQGGFGGKKAFNEQSPLYTPDIMNLKSRMAPELYDQIMGEQFSFDPIAQNARRQFQSDTLPSLMNRFNLGNNRGSSQLMGQLGSAGSGLESQLAAMRQQFGQQRQGILSSLMGPAMSPSFETVKHARTPGGAETGASAMMQMIPVILKALAMAA